LIQRDTHRGARHARRTLSGVSRLLRAPRAAVAALAALAATLPAPSARAQALTGDLSTLDLGGEPIWSPALLSDPALAGAARRAASRAQPAPAAAPLAAPLAARAPGPAPAGERAAGGWRSPEARAAWQALAAEAQRAWTLAAQGALGEDWLARMGVQGPRPVSHTWGRRAAGFLANAAQLQPSPLWRERPHTSYATPELLTGLRAGVYAVHAAYPDSPRLFLGDLSARFGGRLPAHRSHQSGRDADIGYFVRGAEREGSKSFVRVSDQTLDVARTWEFIHGMLKTGLVEYLFIDRRLQRALYQHAQAKGVPAGQLSRWFSFAPPGTKRARGVGIISHLSGHADHMHVRFHAPSSEARGAALVRERGARAFKPRPVFARASGRETLAQVARRHKVPAKTLARWNGLRAQGRRPLPKGKLLIVGYKAPRGPVSRAPAGAGALGGLEALSAAPAGTPPSR